jgi:hypothetical protein
MFIERRWREGVYYGTYVEANDVGDVGDLRSEMAGRRIKW